MEAMYVLYWSWFGIVRGVGKSIIQVVKFKDLVRSGMDCIYVLCKFKIVKL